MTAGKSIVFRYPWMFGRSHDLFFFFFSAIIGLIVLALSQSSIVAASVVFAVLIPTAFGAGPFHQGPTWFMYFDNKNRAHYSSSLKKKLIFYAAPPAILILSVLGMVYCRPLILAIWLVWSIQHLVQQNIGILLLYHNARDNEAIVNRKTETLSLQVPATFFTLLYLRRVMLQGHTFMLFDLLTAAVGIWSLVLLFAYATDFLKQVKEGRSVNVPALGFWVMSAACLFPLGFIKADFTVAFVAPVTWHWFQYIGLNWRLVRNKYKSGLESSNLPSANPLMLLVATCVTLVIVNLGLSLCTYAPGINDVSKNILIGILIGFVNIHYFLDAFMWRFREPYQRAAILPYLKTIVPTQSSTIAAVSNSTEQIAREESVRTVS